MNKSFRKVFKTFSWDKFKQFLAGASSTCVEMVRYFQNPYEDYKSSFGLSIDNAEVIGQINDHVANILKRFPPTPKNEDGGLYVGTSGIAFMFYYLSGNPVLSDKKAQYLQKGLEYLKPGLESPSGKATSFLLGDAGTFAVATVMYKELGDERYLETLKMYKSLYTHYLSPKFLKSGGDEYFVGRSGYLAGALWLTRQLQTKVFMGQELHKICDMIVANGREYSKQHSSPCPLMYHYHNTEYLGAAHGISFILQMLISVPGYLEYNKEAAQDIKETIDYVASLQTEEGNWPCSMKEIGMTEYKLVHWCHGAPGTVYLMAKAYLKYNDQKYYDACLKAGEVVWRKGLLLKGPGICHGVAGNGYVFLLLHRLTGESKYLYRAKQFCDFMKTEQFLRDARLPDRPQSLYEGTAGTVCFLSDLLVPDTAEFPFQDVFTDYSIFA